jgi:hypothetical protein
VARLGTFKLRLLRFNHFPNARAAREGLRGDEFWERLYEYADQTRAILFGK